MITDRRKAKLEQVAAGRQQMTVILENVHDPHNIGAVMRSCDAVGIQEIYVLYTDSRLSEARLKKLDPTSTGVRKWMYVHFFNDVKACFDHVNERYDNILATHLSESSEDLHELDLTQSIAFLFGNEHVGVTSEALQYATGNFTIPQVGMAQSLNISVACAVTIYEAMRQRKSKDMYATEIQDSQIEKKQLLDHYLAKHKEAYRK